MDKDKELALREEIDPVVEQAISMWSDQETGGETGRGMTIKQIAEKYGVSERTVSNRLKTAQEALHAELEKNQGLYIAKLWRKYETAAEKLWNQWLGNQDPAVMQQWRGILKDMRELVKLDKPAKAPVNEKGQAVTSPMIFVIDDSNYKAKERELAAGRVIEGEYKEAIDEPKEDDKIKENK